MHNLEVENHVLFSRLSEDLSLEKSLSESSEGLPRRGEEGAGIHRTFCNKNQVVGTSKDYCLLKKTGHLKEMNLAFFSVWEDARVWAH